MKATKHIPAAVTTVDLATGKETHEAAAWALLPAPADCCQICAMKHPAEQPHNAQSLYYQMAFTGMIGRAPTWADAIAHCAEPVRILWRDELCRRGVWSEPPEGEAPVKHHGMDAP
jgi:hypothetical protein